MDTTNQIIEWLKTNKADRIMCCLLADTEGKIVIKNKRYIVNPSRVYHAIAIMNRDTDLLSACIRADAEAFLSQIEKNVWT